MAPHMAAMVLGSPVVLVFLLVFPVFCLSNMKSFTRDELLNIRQNTPQNLLPIFDYSDVLLNIVVGGAVALFRRFRMRSRGKRAGALVKLRHRGFRTSGESPLSNQQNGQTPSAFPVKQGLFKLCCSVSRKPGWMTPFRTACSICRAFSCLERTATQNQRGNRVAAGRAFTLMKGGVQM